MSVLVMLIAFNNCSKKCVATGEDCVALYTQTGVDSLEDNIDNEDTCNIAQTANAILITTTGPGQDCKIEWK